MSDRVKKWLRERRKQGAIEPSSLTPHPMVQEGKLGAVIALPLLAGLMAMLYVAKTYYITQTDFMFMFGALLGMWMCFLIGVYSWAKSSASEYFLFDREFLFTERLHPRYEIYSKPHQILRMLGPDDEIVKPHELKKRLKLFGFPQSILKDIHNMMKSKFAKHLYYFRQKDVFEGWDAEKNERPYFQSHMIFMDTEFEEQFTFGQGQENWYGPIMYNHPHSEVDVVKVLGWGLDPFSNEPMPICELLHSSKSYFEKGEEKKPKIKLVEALYQIIASQHGLIESQRNDIGNLKELKDANILKAKKILDLGTEMANIRIKEFKKRMRPVSTGLLSSKWVKAIVTVASIIAIVFIVVYVLNWLGYLTINW